MPIRDYCDFILVADRLELDNDGNRKCVVQVFVSPVGEGNPVPRCIPHNLQSQLDRLAQRELDVDGVIQLGETLADVLLPAPIRDFLRRSLDKLKPDQGLRLRLRLAPDLAAIPWEYLYVQRGEGEKDATGFLILDPRISLVRHERLPFSGEFDPTPKQRRLLVASANPHDTGLPPLKLTQEHVNIQQALHGVLGILPDYLEDATLERIGEKLLAGVDIFHFAGHGLVEPTGQGVLVLVTENGEPTFVPADQFAINLRNRGVQLVILGACETGRCASFNRWHSIAGALVEVGIPAVVAMQGAVGDDCAIAFSHSFYQALAAGLILDEAISAGRLAIFNLCHPLRHEPAYARLWSDWGAPTLYLRSNLNFVLPALAEPRQNQEGLSRLPTLAYKQINSSQEYGRALADIDEKLQQQRLTLFIGADLPAQATGLPPRQALADALAVRFAMPTGQRLATITQQIMSHGNRWEFTNFLLQTLQLVSIQPGPFYQALAQLVRAFRPEMVITTAYHQLLEAALQQGSAFAFYSVFEDSALAFADPKRLTILKLYGDLRQVDSLVVTEQDQNALLRGRIQRDMVDEVRRLFRRSSVLFLGYDLGDPIVNALFDEVAGERFQMRSYAVWSGLTEQELVSFASNRGLTVLPIEPLTFVQALLEK